MGPTSQLTQSLSVAASAVFVYDYLLTFPMEVELIWGSRWNAIKIIFIVQRYMPFIDTCFLTLYRELFACIKRRYDSNTLVIGQLAKLTIAQCEILPYLNGCKFPLNNWLNDVEL